MIRKSRRLISAASLKSLRFVSLTEEHLKAVLAIETSVNSAPWSERSFRNELGHAHGVFRVALLEGRVVGYGGIWLVIDEAHVTTIAIDEPFRKLGIGKRLMIELLTAAKEHGMLCSTLEVRASNEPAIKLYKSLGYESIATRKGYYPDNKEDATIMWLSGLDQWEPAAS